MNKNEPVSACERTGMFVHRFEAVIKKNLHNELGISAQKKQGDIQAVGYIHFAFCYKKQLDK